jgi:nucleoid DNA-binding protein
MNKLELITALKNQTDLSKAEAAGVIELVFDMMARDPCSG